MAQSLQALIAEARACTLCAAHLPLGPRPVFHASASARLLIIGQAPGTRVHETGIPWNDASGARLCAWMGIEPAALQDERRIALLPTGFCYPGRLKGGGDAPPRPECAPAWRARFLAHMPRIALTLLVGAHAQASVLGAGAGLGPGPGLGTVEARIRAWRTLLPHTLALPHPSWRTLAWERRNPWFAAEVLPALRARVAEIG